MADEKFTDMTAATVHNAADVFPIVQGGVNKKQTRGAFLTAQSGEAIGLLSPSSGRVIDLLENIQDYFPIGKHWYAANSSGDGFIIDESGNVSISAGAARTIQITQGVSAGMVFTDLHTFIAFNNSFLEMSDSVGVNLQADVGKPIVVAANDGSGMNYDAAGNLNFVGASGITVNVGSDLAQIRFLGGAIVFLMPPGVNPLIPYATANPSDWSGVPGIYEDALNRLASCVAALNHGPIP